MPEQKRQDDPVCEHGTAMDVHCCGCHSGFLFDASSCRCLAPEQKMCGLLSGFGDVATYGCQRPDGHAGSHKNRMGYEWPEQPSMPPEQHVSDRLLKEMWRSVQGPHAELTGPLIRFAGLVASDYRHAALSSDAALEQADLQIGALRAEQARLRAELDEAKAIIDHSVPIAGMTNEEVRRIAGFQRDARSDLQRLYFALKRDNEQLRADHAIEVNRAVAAAIEERAEKERLMAENERLKAALDDAEAESDRLAEWVEDHQST